MWFYKGGKCGYFILINEWRSWVQSALHAIQLYVQSRSNISFNRQQYQVWPFESFLKTQNVQFSKLFSSFEHLSHTKNDQSNTKHKMPWTKTFPDFCNSQSLGLPNWIIWLLVVKLRRVTYVFIAMRASRWKFPSTLQASLNSPPPHLLLLRTFQWSKRRLLPKLFRNILKNKSIGKCFFLSFLFVYNWKKKAELAFLWNYFDKTWNICWCQIRKNDTISN